jgi:predicted enzyme related to lactoylglutathione lyase
MWRVNHFDVSADHPERAMKFYSEVFGRKFEKWNGPFDYWMIMTGDPQESGIDGGIARREDPNAHIINFMDVPSVDECSKSITSNGGKIIQPKQMIPGVGYILIFQDTEENTFGILETDINAK